MPPFYWGVLILTLYLLAGSVFATWFFRTQLTPGIKQEMHEHRAWAVFTWACIAVAWPVAWDMKRRSNSNDDVPYRSRHLTIGGNDVVAAESDAVRKRAEQEHA